MFKGVSGLVFGKDINGMGCNKMENILALFQGQQGSVEVPYSREVVFNSTVEVVRNTLMLHVEDEDISESDILFKADNYLKSDTWNGINIHFTGKSPGKTRIIMNLLPKEGVTCYNEADMEGVRISLDNIFRNITNMLYRSQKYSPEYVYYSNVPTKQREVLMKAALTAKQIEDARDKWAGGSSNCPA